MSEIDQMSHAVQSSLQSALLNLQSLAETLGAERTSQEGELIELIRDQLMRGSRLLVSAFEVLSLELTEVKSVNLGTLVRSALEAHDIDGVIVARRAWPDVVVDRYLLPLAVAHLARNARDATSKRRRAPQIAPALRADGGVDLVVRDWGGKVGALKSPRRAFSSTRPDHVATGLLCVERIARLHGGALSIKSSRQGTHARLSLPARSSPGRGSNRDSKRRVLADKTSRRIQG
jgi:signal transduction histidine kinase